MADTTQQHTISNLKRVLEAFRELDKEIPAQQIFVLLLIADKPNISMRELIEATGHSSSTISRNVAALGDTHRNGEPGFGLVVAYPDPLDARNHLVRLKPKGQTFVDKLVQIMEK